MAEGAVGVSVLFPLLLAAFPARSFSDQVPLIMWSSEGSPMWSLDPPAAGHLVSRSQLDTYLSSALGSAPRTVLLFLQDKLSVDDFTVYGGVFGNKQDGVFPNLEMALRSSSSSLVLPAVSVSHSGSVLDVLRDRLGVAPVSCDPEHLTELHLDMATPALLLIRLPPGTGTDDSAPKDRLRGSDHVIGRVLDVLQAQAMPYTAVYTSVAPSRVVRDVYLDPQPIGRSLLETPNDIYAPVQVKDKLGKLCMLLWAGNLTVSFLRGGRWEKHDLTGQTFGSEGVDTGGSFCNATSSQLTLKYEKVLGFTAFQLTFAMSQRFYKVSARNWFTLDQVLLEYDGQKATFNGSRYIYAPAEYSYHCESVTSSIYPLLVPRTSTDNANQWILSFRDFQIQGFGVTGENFSYASDCAGFFTPGIWMGLLTSLLLLLILTYGLHMILQLRTMDRFDDPKGPSIAVPQNE